MSAPTPTVGRAIEICQRGKELSLYLGGAALAGIALLGAGDLGSSIFSDAPPVLRPLFVSLALISGALIGLSYSAYEWEITRLQRAIADGSVSQTSTPP